MPKRGTTLWLVTLALGVASGLHLAKRGSRDVDRPLLRPALPAEAARPDETHLAEEAAPKVHSQTQSATPLEPSYRGPDDDVVLKELQISEAERERLLALNRALREANSDVNQALLAMGEPALTPKAEALRSEITKPLWDEIRNLLGQERCNSYWMGCQRVGMRPVIVAMFSSSLTEDQVQQVVDLALGSSKTGLSNPTPIYTMKMVDWKEVARKATGILTPDQIATIDRKTNGWWPNK